METRETKPIVSELSTVDSSLTSTMAQPTPSIYPSYNDIETIKYIYSCCVIQDERVEKLILYTRGHIKITAVKNAIMKGTDRYNQCNKPDFSITLNELDPEHLLKLKYYLEERANKTSYISKHTVLENISITSAWFFLGYAASPLCYSLVLGKLVYDQYQHEKLVQQRVEWLLKDIIQIEYQRHLQATTSQQCEVTPMPIPSNTPFSPLPAIMPTIQTYSIFNSAPTAPPMTVDENRNWSQQQRISQ